MYVLTIVLSLFLFIKKRAVRHIKRIALGVPEDKVSHLRFFFVRDCLLPCPVGCSL